MSPSIAYNILFRLIPAGTLFLILISLFNLSFVQAYLRLTIVLVQ